MYTQTIYLPISSMQLITQQLEKKNRKRSHRQWIKQAFCKRYAINEYSAQIDDKICYYYFPMTKS